jgi:hypothetical protein
MSYFRFFSKNTEKVVTISKEGVIVYVDLRKVYRGHRRRLPTGIEGCRGWPSFLVNSE